MRGGVYMKDNGTTGQRDKETRRQGDRGKGEERRGLGEKWGQEDKETMRLGEIESRFYK